ncbi:MAG: glycosyltransferase family 4 protein [Planctomycetes bacterium]|nr:glycosyltransferase family 4 protein [Planctomycetota bacterium]
MRIGIDISVLETGFAERGVATYLRGLLGGLARIGGEDEYVLFAARTETAEPFLRAGLPGRFEASRPAGGRSLLAAAFGWRRAPRREGIDVLHSPALGLPVVRGRARVATIHDLIPHLFAREYLPSIRARFIYRTLVRDALSADRLIAVSEATRKDLADSFRVPPERLTVVYEGVAETYRPLPREEAERVLSGLEIPRPFLLFVGGMTVPEPRKNLPILLAAFLRIREHRPDLHLVLAGKTGAYADEIRGRARALGIEEGLHLTGMVGESALVALYNLAEAFVFPSRYEGFGLPVLEAMACGAPVICARTSSLPEIAGDAALFFDPDDVAGLATAVNEALATPEARRALVDRGFRQASRFRWDDAARATLAVWRGAAKKD